jgi:hypothetical protein
VFSETEEFVPSRALFTLFSAMEFSAGTPSGIDISIRDGGMASTREALLSVSMETNEQSLAGKSCYR